MVHTYCTCTLLPLFAANCSAAGRFAESFISRKQVSYFTMKSAILVVDRLYKRGGSLFIADIVNFPWGECINSSPVCEFFSQDTRGACGRRWGRPTFRCLRGG